MNVGRKHRRHLSPLHIGNAFVRMKHENLDLLTPGNGVDCSRAGIARGCADDGQFLVRSRQKPFEHMAKQLQCNILERQCRPVEQFKQPVLMIELDQGRNGGMSKPTVSQSAQFLQLRLAQNASGKWCHHARRQIDVAQPAHCCNFGFGKSRPDARYIKPAIARQTGQGHTCKIEHIGIAPRADIICAVNGHIVQTVSGAGASSQDYCTGWKSMWFLWWVADCLVLGRKLRKLPFSIRQPRRRVRRLA